MNVDANVVGVAGSELNRTGTFAATAQRQIPVPFTGNWITNGMHTLQLVVPPGVVFSAGNTQSSAFVIVPTGGGGGGGGGICQLDPETGQQSGDCPDSPIIVDVARDGYDLTNVEEGVFFDLNADGITERVAWTKAGSDDAFLTMDRNGNRRIDDGAELFGTVTPVYNDQPYPRALNGFVALIFCEWPSYGRSKADGVINGFDAVWSRLLLWRDTNHNGISEPEELQSVSESGLRSIATNYRESRRRDEHGNEFRFAALSSWDLNGMIVTYPVYDVWLQVRSLP